MMNGGLFHFELIVLSGTIERRWVITLTNLLTDGRTDTQPGAGNVNTRRPKLVPGKNAYFAMYGPKILHEISIMPFEISHQILNPYTAKYAFYEVLTFFFYNLRYILTHLN